MECWIIYLHCFRNTFNISWWSSLYAVSHGCLWPSRTSWCKRGRSNITWYEFLVAKLFYFVSILVIKVSVLVHLFIIFNWQYTLFNKSLRTVTFYLVVPPVSVELPSVKSTMICYYQVWTVLISVGKVTVASFF